MNRSLVIGGWGAYKRCMPELHLNCTKSIPIYTIAYFLTPMVMSPTFVIKGPTITRIGIGWFEWRAIPRVRQARRSAE